jgi:hypothetical protein
MIIGRLYAIPNWDISSTSSEESDDLPSLTDVEWDNLEDGHYKLRPLWLENTSDSLPSELQPFLLSRPVPPRYHQTDVTRYHNTNHSINPASTPANLPQSHTAFPNIKFQPPVGQHYTRTPSHAGHHTTLPNVKFQPPVGQHYTRTPSHAGHHTALPNVGFQPPAGQRYTRMPSHAGHQIALPNVEFQPPARQHHTRTPSHAGHHTSLPNGGFQSPVRQHHTRTPPHVGPQYPGGQHVVQPHYHLRPSVGASTMIMAPPSNVTYPYATNTGLPPGAQFYPPANASTAPSPSTTSFGHRTYIPSTRKWTQP